MNYIAGLAGGFFGALIGIYLLSALFAGTFFKNSEPNERAIASVGIALALAVILSTFGNGMNSGTAVMWMMYCLAALVVAIYRHSKYSAAWTED